MIGLLVWIVIALAVGGVLFSKNGMFPAWFRGLTGKKAPAPAPAPTPTSTDKPAA